MKYIIGDITKETEGLIIHGCNAQGVMGGGVALAIRQKWPQVYEAYCEHEQGKAAMGKLQIIPINFKLFIGNGFTQLNLGSDGKKYADPEAIYSVLNQAYAFCEDNDLVLKTVKIGALRGGLDWETEVLPIFESLNKEYNDVAVEIFDIV